MNTCSPTVKRPWKVPGAIKRGIKMEPRFNDAIDPAFVPSNEAELMACLADPQWRICSGHQPIFEMKSAVNPETERQNHLNVVPSSAEWLLALRCGTIATVDSTQVSG